MRIQHNISAINSHRNLGINNAATSKNLEKLSSGYRINRAGDDAAGLAISEKMRGQIRGLAMAEQNASNGVSLIQTAEGGLNETHAILQRMRELAVQSANGTYQNEVDRENLDKEFQDIKSEIDRISEATHYNGIQLLDGSLGGTKVTYGSVASVANCAAGLSLGLTLSVVAANVGVGMTTGQNYYGAASVSWTENDSGKFDMVATLKDVDGKTKTYKLEDVNLKANGTAGATTDKFSVAAGGVVTLKDANGVSMQLTVLYSMSDSAANTGAKSGSIQNVGFTYKATSATLISFATNAAGATMAAVDEASAYTVQGKGQLVFQIGANAGADQRVGLAVANMDSKSLGLGAGHWLADAKIGTQDDANIAIDIITAATNQVSSTRADMGALQNRLEHTLNNLGVTKENLTAAEASIRDVDMAKEMMEFTKNNILVQASQAMLAQANQLPQGVLQLLR